MEFSDAAAFSAVLQEEKRSWRHYYLSNCLFYSFGVNNHPHFCSMDPQECFEHFHPGSGLPPVAADDSDESVDEAHRAYLSSLIQSLPDGTVVLYCIEEAPGRHVLHTISNKGLRGGHRVHLEDSEVSDAARAFSQEVVRLSRLRRLYGQLGRAIWQPLDALLADAAWVVCVCTGSLARLPLHALEWRGSPLCVQKLVSYGNSLTELSVLPPLRCRVGPQGLHGNPGCAAAAGDGVVHEGADGADGGAGRATAADEGVVHEGVMCDGCGACPIRGRRYKCSTCENYDLCWSCHASRDQVHVAGHGFSCLPRPSQEDVALLVSGPVRAVWSPLDGDEQTAMPELRYAVCEGHLVRSRLGAARCRCLSLQGQDVTLDALVALQMVHMLDSSAGSRIFMHIASHFCVADGPRDDGGPAQGGFVLSDGDVLRVPDFPKVFPRHACVVFLSACSTRGSECSGHDAAARAMTPNECGGIVTTQWKLSDAGALVFADRFYETLVSSPELLELRSSGACDGYPALVAAHGAMRHVWSMSRTQIYESAKAMAAQHPEFAISHEFGGRAVHSLGHAPQRDGAETLVESLSRGLGGLQEPSSSDPKLASQPFYWGAYRVHVNPFRMERELCTRAESRLPLPAPRVPSLLHVSGDPRPELLTSTPDHGYAVLWVSKPRAAVALFDRRHEKIAQREIALRQSAELCHITAVRLPCQGAPAGLEQSSSSSGPAPRQWADLLVGTSRHRVDVFLLDGVCSPDPAPLRPVASVDAAWLAKSGWSGEEVLLHATASACGCSIVFVCAGACLYPLQLRARSGADGAVEVEADELWDGGGAPELRQRGGRRDGRGMTRGEEASRAEVSASSNESCESEETSSGASSEDIAALVEDGEWRRPGCSKCSDPGYASLLDLLHEGADSSCAPSEDEAAPSLASFEGGASGANDKGEWSFRTVPRRGQTRAAFLQREEDTGGALGPRVLRASDGSRPVLYFSRSYAAHLLGYYHHSEESVVFVHAETGRRVREVSVPDFFAMDRLVLLDEASETFALAASECSEAPYIWFFDVAQTSFQVFCVLGGPRDGLCVSGSLQDGDDRCLVGLAGSRVIAWPVDALLRGPQLGGRRQEGRRGLSGAWGDLNLHLTGA